MISLNLKLLPGFLLLFLFAWPAIAQEANFTTPPAYEITPGIPAQPAQRGLVFFTKEFDLDYKGGKVIFSSLTDGTGNTLVDDAIQMKITRPTGMQLGFTHNYHNGCSGLISSAPEDLRVLFTQGINHVSVSLFDVCGFFKSSTPLYLVTENLTPSPSQSPSPSPSPSPSGPAPFLDLPWDYRNQQKTFDNLAYHPYSWFDHKYPLQDFCCLPPVVNYSGQTKDFFYKSHSGYDYSAPQGVGKGTPVLASAAGWATFVSEAKSGGAGNMIKIDHENGYQTWYEHLDSNELIVNTEGNRVHVDKGTKIGIVGLTGRTTGYHIHLSVFEDINKNGNFADDYPFGLTDPLGWEGNYPDPWEEYSQGDKHGAKSYRLFTGLTPPKTQQIPSSGGTVTHDQASLNIPANVSSETLTFKIENGPFEKASDLISSIVPSLFLSATNGAGQTIINFNNPLGLAYDYSKADLSNINEDTISFYFFNPGTNLWEKMSGILDKTTKRITSQTTHFSQFAVMGELLDATPPTTTAQLTGEKGTSNWYHSDVSISLVSEDNVGGKGVSYIVYSLDGEHWNEYQSPIDFNTEGNHKIYFLAHDKVGNDEPQKTVEFSIDKTPPEAKIFIDLDKMDLAVNGLDENPVIVEKKDNLATKKKDDGIYIISDPAGNNLTLDVRDRDRDKQDSFGIYSLLYNNDEPIILEPNLFNVTYDDKKDKLSVKEQNYRVKNDTKIKIQYDSKKDLSTIITKETGSEKVKEALNGLITLQLQTNKGRLEYSY